MTKREAFAEFTEMCPPEMFRAGRRGTRGRVYLDTVMRAEAWNNFTDALCKEGRITMKQYETWTHPWRDS